MVEKETIFSSRVKYTGIFSFKDFYQFCYDWLTEETGLDIMEDKYEEKIMGDVKRIFVRWTGIRKLTDYFRFDIEVIFTLGGLKTIEVTQGGAKVKVNQGYVQVAVKGILARDYEGKFETSAFNKFLRSTYEKWVIPSRIDEYEVKIMEECDEFLGQAKAYLDLEGKK
jgi:hypothetical protein